ncbi:type II toxin-antitoxin system HicA family toxin [Vibrio pectenicida]|uniref:type II toxin-antitoxin system HicA family toxin n=1 Tax=Vibrio pectenicida TaxID=62763 RepID=UPI003B9C20F3
MSKHDKLLNRLLSKPKDFTWDELNKLLSSFDYELSNGKGSRRKFIHRKKNQVISLHEPHPQNIIKRYVI